MGELQVVRELDALLAENLEDASFRAIKQLDDLRIGDALVLYGAGVLGRVILEKLRRVGIEPVAFADDTPEKHGQVIDGLQVIKPMEAVEKYSSRLIFVVTILNPKLSFLGAKHRLRKLTDKPVYSFLQFAWKYPTTFLPYYQFELPQQILAKAKDIRRAFYLWADEESRRQFVAHLKFRLRLDYNAIPVNSGQGYFPLDIFPNLPDNTIFIDCGAYDGDTIRRFVEHQHGHFSRIYAFEPDEINCRRLREYITGLGADTVQKVTIYNAGVGERRTKIKFNATGNMSASFNDEGTSEVEVLPLQDVVDADGATVFLKFDVEGAEWEALKGAERLLERSRPLLAISVYHRPDDLWELPLYINSLNLGYRLFLRTQGEDGMDVICYAIPPQLQDT
jgi:FkbM family methyltransferase